MPSSTSNSSQRAPEGPWGRTWLLAIALTCLALAGMELFWRSQGYEPSIMDNKEAWAAQRRLAVAGGTKTIALLGASRVQVGVSTQVMRERLAPCSVVQLALDGQYPLATLIDLSRDERFSGVAVCSMLCTGFEKDNWLDQQDSIKYYHEGSISNRVNGNCLRWLQRHLVALSPVLNPIRVASSLLKDGSLPKAGYVVVNPDRSRMVDYTKIDAAAQRKMRMDKLRSVYGRGVSPPEEWAKAVAELRPIVRQIESRGGKVVFVRFPTSDDHTELDEAAYPREHYWNRVAELTGAETIHFKDVPSMTGFECPDSSHIDRADIRPFTESLVDELVRRGIFDGLIP